VTRPDPAPFRPRPHRIPFAVLLTAILVGGMLALLGLNTASAANEVTQRKYDAANASLADVVQQLGRDLAARQSPAELAKAAYRLGLIPAANPAFLRFNADGSVTILGTPVTIPAPAKPTSSHRTSHSSHPTSMPKRRSPAATRTPAKTPTTTAPRATPRTTPTPPGTTTTLPGGPR
jgi:hypothetical protein